MPSRATAGPVTLGVDVGATKVRAGRVGRDGRVRGDLMEEPLIDRSPGGVADTITRLVGDLAGPGGRDWGAIGVAIAAQVDVSTGAVLYAPNLNWQRWPLARTLQARLGVPVTLENDARAATWGEWRFGAGRGARALFGLAVGTGVGGAFIDRGRPVRGTLGAAGEIGHLTVQVGGRRCSCPNRGCLEAYAGGWAIAREARSRGVRGNVSDGAGRRVTTRDPTARSVIEAARAGNAECQGILEEAATYLAAGTVSIVNGFNPDRIVVSGGLGLHWPGLLPALRREVRRCCQPPAARSVQILRSTLGPAAPIVGAADLATDSTLAVRRVGTRADGNPRGTPLP